jgi:hypothetical protein
MDRHSSPLTWPHERRARLVIIPGRYSSWFKTPVGEGSGIVEVGADGKLGGGDDTFVYEGHWSQDGDRFRATLSAKRVVPGPPGVFGADEVDIVVSGLSDGATLTCTGFAKQAPGLKLEVVLVRVSSA